jgi:hypothetical protein
MIHWIDWSHSQNISSGSWSQNINDRSSRCCTGTLGSGSCDIKLYINIEFETYLSMGLTFCNIIRYGETAIVTVRNNSRLRVRRAMG